jgi:hypothetical protein
VKSANRVTRRRFATGGAICSRQISARGLAAGAPRVRKLHEARRSQPLRGWFGCARMR